MYVLEKLEFLQVFSQAGVKFPEKVEAFYKNDVSRELLEYSYKSVTRFF